ncbi:Wadjet anti-phage system protein JetD domain-containing protein [Microbacterium sp. DT81.1]|uniref:Wadjet anti-phage system protein JetD domain-containing protein n=1 Tax=Microbacterium sp. DT81.1 TaxID=3393413 RepID=UPI003CF7B175
MKSTADLLDVISRRVRTGWREAITGETASLRLPWRVPVGKPAGNELDGRLNDVRAWSQAVDLFARQHGFTITKQARRSASGLTQEVPSVVVVPSFETAAAAVGRGKDFLRDRNRMALLMPLTTQEVTPAQVAGVVYRIRSWDDGDVVVLAAALAWLAEHSAAGMTAREVPVPGMNSKWLTTSRQREITLLLGRDNLGLTVGRPARRHFRYLDAGHLDAGGRQFDVAAAGDVNRPEYLPDLVIICENVDSAQQLPRRARTIVFEGDGDAGAALIGELDWVKHCPHVLYWGDMDVDGLSIVNTYRLRGLNVATVLMDHHAYLRFSHLGVSVDRSGKPLPLPARPVLTHLTQDEARLLEQLCDPALRGPLRIEQERLPRESAVAEIERLIGSLSS